MSSPFLDAGDRYLLFLLDDWRDSQSPTSIDFFRVNSLLKAFINRIRRTDSRGTYNSHIFLSCASRMNGKSPLKWNELQTFSAFFDEGVQVGEDRCRRDWYEMVCENLGDVPSSAVLDVLFIVRHEEAGVSLPDAKHFSIFHQLSSEKALDAFRIVIIPFSEEKRDLKAEKGLTSIPKQWYELFPNIIVSGFPGLEKVLSIGAIWMGELVLNCSNAPTAPFVSLEEQKDVEILRKHVEKISCVMYCGQEFPTRIQEGGIETESGSRYYLDRMLHGISFLSSATLPWYFKCPNPRFRLRSIEIPRSLRKFSFLTSVIDESICFIFAGTLLKWEPIERRRRCLKGKDDFLATINSRESIDSRKDQAISKGFTLFFLLNYDGEAFYVELLPTSTFLQSALSLCNEGNEISRRESPEIIRRELKYLLGRLQELPLTRDIVYKTRKRGRRRDPVYLSTDEMIDSINAVGDRVLSTLTAPIENHSSIKEDDGFHQQSLKRLKERDTISTFSNIVPTRDVSDLNSENSRSKDVIGPGSSLVSFLPVELSTEDSQREWTAQRIRAVPQRRGARKLSREKLMEIRGICYEIASEKGKKEGIKQKDVQRGASTLLSVIERIIRNYQDACEVPKSDLERMAETLSEEIFRPFFMGNETVVEAPHESETPASVSGVSSTSSTFSYAFDSSHGVRSMNNQGEISPTGVINRQIRPQNRFDFSRFGQNLGSPDSQLSLAESQSDQSSKISLQPLEGVSDNLPKPNPDHFDDPPRL